MTNILISGGTGLVGSALSRLLSNAGYTVAHLSRNPAKSSYKAFKWDIENNYIDKEALQFADAIINLAGAGVADKKWTDAYKKEIYNSRINSVKLLHQALSLEKNHKVKTFISASAIGIYGMHVPEPTFENAPHGTNFLAKVCTDWELEVEKIKALGIRTAIIRIGIVLSKHGGFIPAIVKPAKFGFGAALGNGNMLTSWIHINDLCQMFKFVLENNQIEGVYNGVAPNIVTNKVMVKAICNAINRPMILPPIPAFALKLILGEMADMILSSQNISCKKIIDSGFEFSFTQAVDAVNDLLTKP